MELYEALRLVDTELMKAQTKHPIFARRPASQLAILVEEVGEVAKDINDGKNYKTEVAQVAAVCLRILMDK